MADAKGTDPTKRGNPFAARSTRRDDRGGDHFAAPLGAARSGRLRFANGAHRVTIRADLRLRGLCCARFGTRMPTMWVQGGLVTIRYPRLLTDDWLDCRSERPAEVALNGRIPWDVEVRGGASRLLADLLDLPLGSLTIEGGAGRVEVMLPIPVRTVAVVVLGGASNVTISRPEGVAARLRVKGGATNLRFDDRRVGATGGELDLRGRGYDGATDRYDVAVTGGANNLSIDTQRGAKDRGSGALT